MDALPGGADLGRTYDDRAARAAGERVALDDRSRVWARVRLALALGIAAALIAQTAGAAPLAWVAAAAGALTFTLVAVQHARVDARAAAAATQETLNRDAAARLRRQWQAVEEWGAAAPVADAGHPYVADLDVLGHASLWRLVGRARSGPGDIVLGRWMRAPAPPDDVHARQEAARALAPALEWRQALAAAALQTRSMRPHEWERFLAWGESEPWLRRRAWLYLLAAGLSVATLALVALHGLGVVQGGWAAAMAAAVVLSLAVQRPLAGTLEAASWEVALRGWRELAARVERLPGAAQSPRLAALRAPIAGDQQRPSAAGALDRLERILGFASVRHTPILHWPLQALTLWDFHVWWTLEGWQQRHGRHVRGWIDAIAEVEALSALAGLAHDHPAWAWPIVSPDEDRLAAAGLTHPLLAPERAVGNDIGVGPPGRVLLVTGSNMSGKSTLLRAIGLNAVLAQMGAPVAARHLRMPPLAVVTSMRLQDSLEDGVSFFMASLARLRLVVDRARLASADPSQPMTLYLLDELLGGTNTAEREVAVRGVVRHLVACRAIGALTSHDLALAETSDLRAHGDCVHFRESLGAGEDAAMTFDYRLRPGVATSRNALALMRAVGLGDLV